MFYQTALLLICLPDMLITATGVGNMEKVKCLWLTFIQCWRDLFNFAPQAIEHKFEINTENNTLASHFNAALGYLNNAIESERN